MTMYDMATLRTGANCSLRYILRTPDDSLTYPGKDTDSFIYKVAFNVLQIQSVVTGCTRSPFVPRLP